MNGTLIKYGLIAVAAGGYFAWTAYDGSRPQSADLGRVLDDAVYSVEYFDTKSGGEGETASDEQMEEFTTFLAGQLNNAPRFYDDPIGLELQEDAVFNGFADKNANTVRDTGEKDIFTLEFDTENNRIIATDAGGQSVDKGFSMTGIFAGLLIGNLLSRQINRGVNRSSLASKQATSRNSYTASARSRSRAGGSRAGK